MIRIEWLVMVVALAVGGWACGGGSKGGGKTWQEQEDICEYDSEAYDEARCDECFGSLIGCLATGACLQEMDSNFECLDEAYVACASLESGWEACWEEHCGPLQDAYASCIRRSCPEAAACPSMYESI